jgi:hypothetical protein
MHEIAAELLPERRRPGGALNLNLIDLEGAIRFPKYFAEPAAQLLKISIQKPVVEVGNEN